MIQQNRRFTNHIQPERRTRFGRLLTAMALAATILASPAFAGDFCTVGSNLDAAKRAVQVAQQGLAGIKPKPPVLGSLIAAKARMRAAEAQLNSATAIRNRVRAKLATQRTLAAAVVQENRRQLAKLGTKSVLQQRADHAKFLIDNQTSAQKQAETDLAVARHQLAKIQAKLQSLQNEVTALESSLESGKNVRGVGGVDSKVAELQKRIKNGREIEMKKISKIKKLEVKWQASEEDRREIVNRPAILAQIAQIETLGAEIAQSNADVAVLEAELITADRKVQRMEAKVRQVEDHIAAINRRRREIAQWQIEYNRLDSRVSTAKGKVRTAQVAFDAAVRAKDLALAAAKRSARLPTLNARLKTLRENIANQSKTKSQEQEKTWRKKISDRKYDASTERLLISKLTAYWHQVYLREAHQGIIRGYVRVAEKFRGYLKQVEPFDCSSFADAQAYAGDLRKVIGKFTKYTASRNKKVKTATDKANKARAEFNKIWNKPRVGLSDIVVSQRQIRIVLWDHGRYIDGDTVDLYVNDSRVRRIVLKKEGTQIDLNLPYERNKLAVKAIDEGTKKPNTASINISHVSRGKATQKWSLKTNQVSSMYIFVQRP